MRSSTHQGVVQPKGFPPLPKDWVSEWETFSASDGKLQLFSVTHHRETWREPVALLALHGLGEHGGRYLHLPHYLQSVVSSVTCVDHRGHGRSEGLRGHVARFDLFVEDAVVAIRRLDEQLRRRFGRAEIHLLGHSFGGLVALRTVLSHPSLPLRSVTISAPLLGIRVKVPPVKKAAALALAKVWGSLHMTNEIDANLVSRDPEVVRAYLADRLVHNKITPQFFVELQEAMANTLKRHSGLMVPAQFLVPLEDRIVDPNATIGFFEKLEHREKLLKTYPGFFHEPMNDLGKEQVFEDLKAWISAHKMPGAN